MSESPQYLDAKKVGIGLGIGIFLVPYIFSWVLLRRGYGKVARILSFSWLAVLILGSVAWDYSVSGSNANSSSYGKHAENNMNLMPTSKLNLDKQEFSAKWNSQIRVFLSECRNNMNAISTQINNVNSAQMNESLFGIMKVMEINSDLQIVGIPGESFRYYRGPIRGYSIMAKENNGKLEEIVFEKEKIIENESNDPIILGAQMILLSKVVFGENFGLKFIEFFKQLERMDSMDLGQKKAFRAKFNESNLINFVGKNMGLCEGVALILRTSPEGKMQYVFRFAV